MKAHKHIFTAAQYEHFLCDKQLDHNYRLQYRSPVLEWSLSNLKIISYFEEISEIWTININPFFFNRLLIHISLYLSVMGVTSFLPPSFFSSQYLTFKSFYINIFTWKHDLIIDLYIVYIFSSPWISGF